MSSSLLSILLSLCLLGLCWASAPGQTAAQAHQGQHAQAQRAQQIDQTPTASLNLEASEEEPVEVSYGQYKSRSPLMYRVATTYGDARVQEQQEHEEDMNLLSGYGEYDRGGRHFSTLDACHNSVCDQVIRQAHSLARIKLLREYIKDTVAMLDRLVTAVDSQIITAGNTLTRSVGRSCRAVHSVLADVTKMTGDVDRSRSEALSTWYPVK